MEIKPINVLWVTNFLLPEATTQLDRTGKFAGTGGWILALANSLSSSPEFKLSIVAITPFVKETKKIQGEKITYYAIPYGKGDCHYNKDYELSYRQINKLLNPDIVHIHGTEYPHSLAALRAFGANKTIVSIQGLVSMISPYYLAGLTRRDILRNMSIRDIIRGSIIREQREMKHRGEYEQKLISEAHYIGGRTSWDKENIWSINSKASYFHCGEILRQEFYNYQWTYQACKPHSVFLSQGESPIKGFHKVLEALAIVKKHYPDVHLRVAGHDITYSGVSFLNKLRISSYGRLVKRMIRQNDLIDNVEFIGALNAEEMKNEYLRANVFVCPSVIENSPNSLGEAQVLGVPCIASYVGGVMDMMKGDEEHLYRFEETGMLAAKICEIFELQERVDTGKMRKVAQIRHDVNNVLNELIENYKYLVSNF